MSCLLFAVAVVAASQNPRYTPKQRRKRVFEQG